MSSPSHHKGAGLGEVSTQIVSDRATDGGLEFKYLIPLLAERALNPGMTNLFPLGLGCDPGTGGMLCSLGPKLHYSSDLLTHF